MSLHFKPKDHFDVKHRLINQNLKIDIASQGDLMEATGMLLWYWSLQPTISPLYKDVVDGIMVMYQGVNGKIIPRVKSFSNVIPNSEPDRWDIVNGIWYRVKDVSDSQEFYILAGLIKIWEKTNYEPARQIASSMIERLSSDGWKLMWDGKPTRNGNFASWLLTSSNIRAYGLAKKMKKKIPFTSRLAMWLFRFWTKLYALIGQYGFTDAFNTCLALWFMGEEKMAKDHIAENPDMKKELKKLYSSNTPDNADVIQNDMKWKLLEMMMS